MTVKKVRNTNKENNLCKLVIGEEMTIYAVADFKKNVSQQLDDFERFEIDLEKVEEVDSAGIQLLLSLKNKLLQQKKSLKFINLSPSVSRLVTLYQLSEPFNLGDA